MVFSLFLAAYKAITLAHRCFLNAQQITKPFASLQLQTKSQDMLLAEVGHCCVCWSLSTPASISLDNLGQLLSKLCHVVMAGDLNIDVINTCAAIY